MAPKIYFDKVTLGFGQSLLIGHRPDNLTLATIGSGVVKDIEVEKFGLFESATPNFHTYYPNVTAADLKPKEGDFVKPIFRALSEVIVHKKTNPIDFSMNGVLKASMGKLLAQTVYANHEALVGNELGVVSDVSWQEGYTTQNGIKVPGGINAEFKIDAKSHPNIARAVMMDPPSIHSNSVTVQFAWEKSHPSMDLNDFRGKLGTYGEDGILIRRIVTDIPGYHETSLVAHGADPFAQRVGKKGEINNPEYADGVYSLSMQGKEKPLKYYFSYKDDVTSLSETENSTPNESTNINSDTMKDLIQKLSVKYNKPEAEITEQFITDALKAGDDAVTELGTTKTELATEKGKVTDLTTQLGAEKTKVTNLTTDNTNLTAEVDKYKPVAEKYIESVRNEVKRTYTILKADKADAAKLALIEKAPLEDLEVSLAEYNTEVELKFPATCKDCQSTNVARNTAEVGAGTGKPDGTGAPKSDAQIAAELRAEAKTGYIIKD